MFLIPPFSLAGAKPGRDPDSSDVIEALLECKEKGAKIVTLSVGGFKLSK